MEEFAERAELRRMQREQERERRRIRDRQRRQSMTQEQRERHLARRRRNYQLRRQRAANSNSTFIPQPLDSSTGEASTSEEHPRLLSCSISDYTVLHTDLPHHHHLPSTQAPQETFSFGTQSNDGSSVHFETLAYKPTNLQRKSRLNHIKQLARNMIHPIGDDTETGIHQVAAELIAKGHVSANGSIQKSLRLNRVKQLARSLNSASKESLAENQNGTVVEGDHITFPTKTCGYGFECC